MRRELALVVLLCSIVFAAAGCDSNRTPQKVSSTDSLLTERLVPDTRLIRAEISLYTRQFTTARIVADTLVRFERIDSTMGYRVTAHLLDTTGHITTTMTSDSAVIREKSQRLQLYGHGVVKSGDTLTVESEYLEWDPVHEQLSTESFVRIKRRGDVISGIGMIADRKLGRIRLKKQVKGAVQNIDEIPGLHPAKDSATVPPDFSPVRLRQLTDSAAESTASRPDSSHR